MVSFNLAVHTKHKQKTGARRPRNNHTQKLHQMRGNVDVCVSATNTLLNIFRSVLIIRTCCPYSGNVKSLQRSHYLSAFRTVYTQEVKRLHVLALYLEQRVQQLCQTPDLHDDDTISG